MVSRRDFLALTLGTAGLLAATASVEARLRSQSVLRATAWQAQRGGQAPKLATVTLEISGMT